MNQGNQNQYFLTGKINHFEEKMAIIEIEDGQKISWPIVSLPAECQAGSEVKIFLSTNLSDNLEKEKIAKAVLNEIFNNTNGRGNGGNQ